MYVCLCHAVSDHDIKEAVESGVQDLHDLQANLGVGTGCGTCQEYTQQLLDETLAARLGYAA